MKKIFYIILLSFILINNGYACYNSSSTTSSDAPIYQVNLYSSDETTLIGQLTETSTNNCFNPQDTTCSSVIISQYTGGYSVLYNGVPYYLISQQNSLCDVDLSYAQYPATNSPIGGYFFPIIDYTATQLKKIYYYNFSNGVDSTAGYTQSTTPISQAVYGQQNFALNSQGTSQILSSPYPGIFINNQVVVTAQTYVSYEVAPPFTSNLSLLLPSPAASGTNTTSTPSLQQQATLPTPNSTGFTNTTDSGATGSYNQYTPPSTALSINYNLTSKPPCEAFSEKFNSIFNSSYDGFTLSSIKINNSTFTNNVNLFSNIENSCTNGNNTITLNYSY